MKGLIWRYHKVRIEFRIDDRWLEGGLAIAYVMMLHKSEALKERLKDVVRIHPHDLMFQARTELSLPYSIWRLRPFEIDIRICAEHNILIEFQYNPDNADYVIINHYNGTLKVQHHLWWGT